MSFLKFALRRRFGPTAFLVGLLTLSAGLTMSAAAAADDTNLRYGVTAYNSGDFKTASQYLSLCARSRARSPICLLYLGHSLIRLGRVKEAVVVYNALTDEFHNTAEARQAAKCIRQYDPALFKVLAAKEKARHFSQQGTASSQNIAGRYSSTNSGSSSSSTASGTVNNSIANNNSNSGATSLTNSTGTGSNSNSIATSLTKSAGTGNTSNSGNSYSSGTASHTSTISNTVSNTGSSSAATPPAVASRKSLLERITVCPPKFGHPEVSKTTIDTVRNCVEKLPKSIYKILDEGDATITITPSTNDYWPNSGEGVQYGTTNLFGEMMGRTYAKGSVIFERSILRGSSQLGPPRSISEIRNGTYKELGHALDACMNDCSKDQLFQQIATTEGNLLSGPFKRELKYLTQPSELFAQIAGELMGGEELVGTSCPDSRAWIRSKLRL